jgi:hypothetical protein
MKLIFSFLFLLTICAVTGAAQNTCAARLENAPAVLNFKLGMSPAAAQAVVGKSLKIKNKRSGEYTFFQNFIDSRAPDSLTGTRAVYLRFYDGALYQIEIFYEEKNEALTLEDFINRQSAKLNLPVDAWKIKFGIAEINCGEFSLVADKFLNPRLELTDPVTLAKVEAKRKKSDK